MKARSFPVVLAILAVAALSTLAIACRTTGSFGTPSSVELRQVQQVATVFNSAIDLAIARRGMGYNDDYVDICGPKYTVANKTMFDHFVTRVPQGPRTTMDDMLKTLRTAQPAPGEERVLYPGLSEAEEIVHRRVHGIPLHKEVLAWFAECTRDLGLAPLAALR